MRSRQFWPDRILPLAQLLVCMVALWPAHARVLSELAFSARLHLMPPLTGENLAVPQFPFSDDESANRAERIGLRVPMILNSPVLLVQMPYILLNPDKMEWVPEGISTDVWRAVSWPIIGIALWWSASRGFRALFALRRSGSAPIITLIEAAIAAVLVICGIGAAVGIVTTTPADRKDALFTAFVAAFCLWCLIGGATLSAWILQWRPRRRRKRVSTVAAVES